MTIANPGLGATLLGTPNPLPPKAFINNVIPTTLTAMWQLNVPVAAGVGGLYRISGYLANTSGSASTVTVQVHLQDGFGAPTYYFQANQQGTVTTVWLNAFSAPNGQIWTLLPITVRATGSLLQVNASSSITPVYLSISVEQIGFG